MDVSPDVKGKNGFRAGLRWLGGGLQPGDRAPLVALRPIRFFVNNTAVGCVAGRIRRLLATADKRAEDLGIPGTEHGVDEDQLPASPDPGQR
jgi:hypothetical protein